MKSFGWQFWLLVWLIRNITDVHSYVHPFHVLWVLNLFGEHCACSLWVFILSLFLRVYVNYKSADKLCSVIYTLYPGLARSVKLLEVNWQQFSVVGLLDQIWGVQILGVTVISGMVISGGVRWLPSGRTHVPGNTKHQTSRSICLVSPALKHL